ncbi:hypothetical protein [Marinobacter mobilis]|uniref:Uncharacterized protein n=1 Tax=Marinobacter mobilis TaxID=488533 RepID=A0A1H3BVF6_9GAMM|nr:hypothetical protein [Marinobacter mobilis]SDX45806.1 hypothetical protein SAMN04487960_109175 [Marinobacter mobilis]
MKGKNPGNGTHQNTGVCFPLNGQNQRSTSDFGKQVMAAALAGVSDESAQAILAERSWRKNYYRHAPKLTALSSANTAHSLQIAEQGLDAVHNGFRFSRGGTEQLLSQAMDRYTESTLHTGCVEGTGAVTNRRFEMPYRGDRLSGEAFTTQVNAWERKGIIEPSCAQALRDISTRDLATEIRGHRFALLGASSEMGPCLTLLALGATVIAVDLDRPQIWAKLIACARELPGTLLFPMHQPYSTELSDEELAASAGANLLTETPEIRTWLCSLPGPMTVGAYAYLDGAKHVSLAVAMDAIVKAVLARDPRNAFAFMLTPTDVFAIPEETAEASERAYARSVCGGGFPGRLRAAGRRKHMFKPNLVSRVSSDNGRQFGLIDSLVPQQGPNYNLAKNIQRWRAIVARQQGHRVSANVAAATMTASVTSNKLFELGYEGCALFGIEAFEPDTNRSLMAGLLIYDMIAEESVANPDVQLDNPQELFMFGANHGGFWRTAFQVRSALHAAVLVGVNMKAQKYLGSLWHRKKG